ncbi:uncharacterized protein LOC121264598 [Juglans microcarpa x Juglans regia]|uniref:uncharacterized protein LOC121264598 n=1 Tax=Juglans microcarpa x Juglans regia TaxID=2249226 RepID=UPI001B7E422B|nr:uncharacterized protein LOC121264598 [Juglans microcarpa x Juglans regia]
MTDFSRNADSGCFSGMFGRNSCFRSLPTHPADNVIDSKTIDKSDDQKENPTAKAKIKAPASPGVIARLMGLDSLPETIWVPGKVTSDSLVRSRSVSFADYMLQLDISQTQHRRVRTSVSFREVPALPHQQNRDLLVVFLDNVDKTKGKGTKVRKCERDSGDLKQRKAEQRSKKKENTREIRASVKTKKKKKMGNQENNRISMLRNEPRRVVSTNHSNRNTTGSAKRLSLLPTHKKNEDRTDVANLKEKSPLKPINQKKQSVEAKPKRNRKPQGTLAVEVERDERRDSQNSSPIYLLEVNDSEMQQEAQRPLELNLNRTSSPKVSYTDDLRIGAINKDCDNQMDIPETQYYVDVVGQLFRMTETDIEESNWIAKNSLGFEGFEEVCQELERYILDVLLNQVLDELVEIDPFENLVHIMLEEANKNWV